MVTNAPGASMSRTWTDPATGRGRSLTGTERAKLDGVLDVDYAWEEGYGGKKKHTFGQEGPSRTLPSQLWRGLASKTGYMIPDKSFVSKFGTDKYGPGGFKWSPTYEWPGPSDPKLSKSLWDYDFKPNVEDRYDWMKL